MARVNQVVGDCPSCKGTLCFGNLLVQKNTLIRGCSYCDFKQRIALPSTHKRIIYLDQSLLSSAFHGRDLRAVKAVGLVSSLAGKQMLVAPHSNVHEDETHLWSGYGGKTPPELMRFIERTARGVEFVDTQEVEQSQLIKGFRAFLGDCQADYSPDLQDAMSGSVHGWHNYYFVVTPYRGNAAQTALWKQESARRLVSQFDYWLNSACTFDEHVAMETASVGPHYINQFEILLARTASGDLEAALDAPMSARCVKALLRLLPHETPWEERIQKVVRFFASPHFAALPRQWLSARIIATLRTVVRNGSFANREKAVEELAGFFFDLNHIATYAPYCDAVFIDNQMASWVANSKVGLTKRYGTLVFSMNTMDEFMSWLVEVEKSMTDSHREAVARAYGGVP